MRINHINFGLCDPVFIMCVNAWFDVGFIFACFLMFTKFKFWELTLENCVVVLLMCMYLVTDGLIDDWYLVHFGSCVIGGAGLVITEMIDISVDVRIMLGCAGMYEDEYVFVWKRVVDFVYKYSQVKMGF